MSDTTTDTLARIELLIAQITPAITISERYECATNTLPTFIIKAQGATRESISSTQFEVTRNHLLMLLVTGPCDDDLEAQDAARELCQPYLDSIPAFFAKRPRLESIGTDSGLPGVVRTSLLTDDGAQLTTWNQKTYAGVMFRLAVTNRVSF